jgi:hypothetical protein
MMSNHIPQDHKLLVTSTLPQHHLEPAMGFTSAKWPVLANPSLTLHAITKLNNVHIFTYYISHPITCHYVMSKT